METIITIFTVLSMYMNITSNTSSRYCYNADIENDVLTTMYVYEKNDEGLKEKLVCHFDYDAEGRLVEKQVSRWDSWNQQYVPAYRLQLTYNEEGYELAYSQWNNKTEEWKASDEKMIYHIEKGHVLSVNYLQKSKGDYYRSTDALTIISPYEGMLLAGE